MITQVDPRFREEAERFALRFACEDCIWYDAEAQRCSHAYPNEAHRRVDLDAVHHVTFCKEFELV